MAKLDLKSPAAQKIVLCVLLSGGLLGVFFFTHLLPFTYPNQRDKLVALKADYEKKSTELARTRATVSDLPRFEAEYGHLHERWAMAAELVPEDRDLPALLRKITLSAQQTGVEFVVFRPTDSKPQEHYVELPVQLSVYGGYHEIGSFMAELANMRRIVTVSSLALKVNSKGDAGSGTTSAEFTASAYSMMPSSTSASASSNKEGASHARKSS